MQQQHALPALTKQASQIAAKFEDSTHQIWLCHSVQGPLVLKVCRPDTIKHTAFWQGMNTLFAIDFPHSLGDIQPVYQRLAEWGVLPVPHFIASQADSFLLTRYLPGEMMQAGEVTAQSVILLAKQISQLHQHSSPSWGAFPQPKLNAKQWSLQLQDTLSQLAENYQNNVPEALLTEALMQAAKITPKYFVPIMPDLRWDQFLSEKGRVSALVDLDAVVYGPAELELVLLEYLLDAAQAEEFSRVYQQLHTLPDLSSVRMTYRLLLFLMNVLGEQDMTLWMQSPKRF